MKTDEFSFQVRVETRTQTGEVVAVYLQVREGKVKTTKECAEGAAFADYDKDGRLLGIELLGPCRVGVLDRIARHAPAKRFVREAVPRGMLVGA